LARAKLLNIAAVNRFFDIIEAEFEKLNYNTNRIFNVDETGLSVVQSKIPKAVALKRKKTDLGNDLSRKGILCYSYCLHQFCCNICPSDDDFPQEKPQQLPGQGSSSVNILHVSTSLAG
jgi:hypothetical protein